MLISGKNDILKESKKIKNKHGENNMKTTKITLIALGALILESGVSFTTVEATGRDGVRHKRAHAGDARLSTEAPSVFFSVSEMGREPYVYMDMERNHWSGTDAHKIAKMIKPWSPEDQKNVTVSMKISPTASSEDLAVLESYGIVSDGNHVEMHGDDFVNLMQERAPQKFWGFIEVNGVRGGGHFSPHGLGLGPREVQPHSIWMWKDLAVVRNKKGEVLYDTKRKKLLASRAFNSENVKIVDSNFAVKVLQKLDPLDPDAKVDLIVKAPADPVKAESLKGAGFIETAGGNLAASQIRVPNALSLISNLEFQAFISLIIAQNHQSKSFLFDTVGSSMEISSSENASKS
ncbi:MAG: hypothetical protein B7X84_07810 [Alphaproteobacteria bacterium 17-39-52]|nr:MAG: hypothetical protein B7X84_07810 [Alphaproteobacteria bacterium 17-39-52]